MSFRIIRVIEYPLLLLLADGALLGIWTSRLISFSDSSAQCLVLSGAIVQRFTKVDARLRERFHFIGRELLYLPLLSQYFSGDAFIFLR